MDDEATTSPLPAFAICDLPLKGGGEYRAPAENHGLK